MKLLIRETSKFEDISLYSSTGQDLSVDTIDNAGYVLHDGLERGYFYLIPGTDIYSCHFETYIHWRETFQLMSQLATLRDELILEHGAEVVWEAISDVACKDLSDYASKAIETLKERF